MTSVRVREAKKAFNGQPVLRGVDFAVREGAIAALLGPSGCGKTTLLRLIAGFERLDGGAIEIHGREVARDALHVPPERRRIGYVPQEGALFPHLTVAGNVGFGLARRDRTKERIGDVLALVGVAELAGRYPHELSGGQQQRVALARALAPRPEIVLLDEPFNGLDLDLRRAVSAEVVATLRRSGASAVLVTHDPEEAFASADTVAVMDHGAIAQQDDPRSVYLRPASADVARITGAAVFLDAKINGAMAETALGSMPLGAVSAGVNGVARICVRPEQIVLGEPGCGRPAKILSRSFRGDHTVLTVAIGEFRLPVRAPTSFVADDAGEVQVTLEGSCVAFAPLRPSKPL